MTTATTTPTSVTEDPPSEVSGDAAWESLLARLNRLSVTKHFDA